MADRRSGMLGRRALAVAILLALSGCYEEKDETIPQTSAASPTSGAAQADWLEVDDARAPDAFLAQASGLPVERLRDPLAALAAHYRESPRMIANRVLQLWTEYPGPPLDQLMHDLVPLSGHQQQSLGQVAQQYRVLRDSGASHAQALADALPGAGR